MKRKMCNRCRERVREAKVIEIDGVQANLCGACVDIFEGLKDFYKIPKQDQFEAFKMFCQKGITVKYEENTDESQDEEAINNGISKVGGW